MHFSSWTWLTPEEESVSAWHIKVLTTALLCAARWWKSKAKYWSVCVGFRYTSVLILPSSSLDRSASRNGSCPLDSLSAVNGMCGSMLLKCSWKGSTNCKSRGNAVQVSSTYLLQKQGGMWKVAKALRSMSSITRFTTTTDTGDPMAVLWTLLSNTR